MIAIRIPLALLALSAPLAAQSVDIQFIRTDVHAAIAQIARGCGRAVVVGPEVRGEVTAVFPKVHWRTALESTAAVVGADVVEPTDRGGVWRVVATASAVTRVDERTLRGPKHFVDGYAPQLADGRVNVVVEIPTGTTQKWEVDKSDGLLRWEIKDGKPRVVAFLGYPGNYGMIPRTLLAKEAGGDGDPLDVLVLGDPLPRGTVTPVRLLGVLRLDDGGEQDDKLIAVRDGSPFAAFASIEELAKQHPNALAVVETWFTSYKGPGEIESRGYAGRDAAERVLAGAVEGYRQAHADYESK